METDHEMPQSLNFAFLAAHEPLLVRYAAQAERYVFEDPNAALIKLRQLIEGIAQLAAAHLGWDADGDARLLDILRHLRREDAMSADVADAFHHIRKAGNRAVHHHEDSRSEAFRCLRMARTVAVWYVRAFGRDRQFNPGPFVPPPDPAEADRALLTELDTLRQAVATERASTSDRQDLLAAREAAEAHARAAWVELAAAVELAADAEAERERMDEVLRRRLRDLRQAEEGEGRLQAARDANRGLTLEDEQVRAIIDQQLRDAGWQCDSQRMSHRFGAEPEDGESRAIADWPCAAGHADYVLFVGLTPVAAVQVERGVGALPGALQSAAARARQILVEPSVDQAAPFAFAASGGMWRPELPSESGLWMDDVRDPQSARPIASWPRPEDLVRRAAPTSASTLARALALRPHVETAVDALFVSPAPAHALIAAGAGRSFAALALTERLLSAHPTARVLLVAHVGGRPPEDAFDTAALATVRACGRVRVGDLADLVAQDPADAPPNALAYEFVVVDECASGALFAPPWDVLPPTERVERYRAALSRFDASLYAVAASSEMHTRAVFGDPIHAYTLEDAVADGWLRLPTRTTTLNWNTPRFGPLGAEALTLIPDDSRPDDVPSALERDDIGARVLQPSAERALAATIAERVDPWTGPNALVICGGARHAALVALSIEQALEDRFGADAPPVVTRPSSAPDATRRLREGSVAIAVVQDALCSNLVDAPVGLVVFASAASSIAQYADRIGAASRTSASATSSSLEIVHGLARVPLPEFPDAIRSGLPRAWTVDGDRIAAVDHRTFTAEQTLSWGREGTPTEHFEAFLECLAAQAEARAAWSGGAGREAVRPALRAFAERRFSPDSIAGAAAALGAAAELPLLAWTTHETLEASLKGAAERSERWTAHQEETVRALSGARPAAEGRLRVYAKAARRDGILDARTPEVIRLGGADAAKRSVGASLDSIAARLILRDG